jgi:hypothetical protein
MADAAKADGIKTYAVTAKETVTQTYHVKAKDEDDARKRLHLHWKDPEMLREGIVTVHGDPTPGNREVAKDEIKALASRADGAPVLTK